MADVDARMREMEGRVTGLTQALAAILASSVVRGNAEAKDIMNVLHLCETELLRMQEPTHQSEQVVYLREEFRRRLPISRSQWDD